MRMSLAFAAQVSMRSEAAGRPWMDWEVVYPMAWRSGCATRHPRSSGWGTGPPSWSVVEWRRVFEVHGVPHGRPLPDLVEGALVAVCPELVPRSRAKFQARQAFCCILEVVCWHRHTRLAHTCGNLSLRPANCSLLASSCITCLSTLQPPHVVTTQGEEFGRTLDYQGLTRKMGRVSKVRTATRGILVMAPETIDG